MRHKIVTFFLHDQFDKLKGNYGDPKGGRLFGVVEHLDDYLKDGWLVKDVKTMGGAGGTLSGWVIVLLERPSY